MEVLNSFNYSFVTVYKIAKTEIKKIDFALCKQPTETLDAFYKRQTAKPDILINGGLFGLANGNTYFTYRDEHNTISYMDKYTEGFGITAQGTLQYGNYGKDGIDYKDFVCGYPVLIRKGQVYVSSTGKELDYKTRRTVLAYNNTHYFIVIVESPGLNFSQLKTVLLNLGVKEAINLDGGGSTRLLYKGERKSANIASRAVDNVIAFYLNNESNSTINNTVTNTTSITLNILQYGSKGEAVKNLQRCLNGWGYNCGTVDGDFGPKTRDAVKLFQSSHALEGNGIVEKNTWAALTGSKS